MKRDELLLASVVLALGSDDLTPLEKEKIETTERDYCDACVLSEIKSDNPQAMLRKHYWHFQALAAERRLKRLIPRYL